MKCFAVFGKEFGLVLILAVLALFGASPPGAEAKIDKDIITVSQDASSTLSAFSTLGVDATVKAAKLVIPADMTSTTKTLTLNSYNGSTIGEVLIYSVSTTSTGVVALTGMADLPVAGEVRVRIQTDSAEAAARTYRLLLFYDR
jgi:hypothetical protein